VGSTGCIALTVMNTDSHYYKLEMKYSCQALHSVHMHLSVHACLHAMLYANLCVVRVCIMHRQTR